MSLMIKADEVVVYKFKVTGIIELCNEVVELVRSGEFDSRNLNPTTGTFSEDDRCLYITFKEYPKE